MCGPDAAASVRPHVVRTEGGWEGQQMEHGSRALLVMGRIDESKVSIIGTAELQPPWR